jgi:hypothetical protein
MTKAYNDLPLIVKVLLQIFFGWPISLIYRVCAVLEGKGTTVNLVIALLVGIFLGWLLWIVDLITVILYGKITWLVL